MSLLTDVEIARLLAERKPLRADYRISIELKSKRGHSERELQAVGDEGSTFHLVLRRSDSNALDFSVILCYSDPKTTQVWRLRRYNGKSHEHTNKLEGYTFYGFHIHTATERYQQSGFREDSFAEETDRFGDFEGAVRCMLSDCGFEMPPDPRGQALEGFQP